MNRPENKIRIAIDGSNLAYGGCKTHLLSLLKSLTSAPRDDVHVIVFGPKKLLNEIKDSEHITKMTSRILERNFVVRAFWQRFILPRKLVEYKCDLLYAPGGTVLCSYRPSVTMSRNMLPFDYREIWRYRGNILFFKWIALRYAQMRSFRAADGVIFLTKHAAKVITDAVGRKLQNAVVIPHGVDERFRNPPRKAREIRNLNSKDPFRIIYVSTIDRYKHQWRLVKAIHDLRIETRWPLELYLVGSYERSSFYRLQREIKISDPDKIWAFYLGPAPQDSLVRLYDKCDLAVFISTCENMPNVLLEKMSSGLPIISSSIKANQEILGDTGFYVFSENVVELKAALRKAIESADVRAIAAEKNYVRAFQYDWNRCASSTFAFLREVAATSKWK